MIWTWKIALFLTSSQIQLTVKFLTILKKKASLKKYMIFQAHFVFYINKIQTNLPKKLLQIWDFLKQNPEKLIKKFKILKFLIGLKKSYKKSKKVLKHKP